MYRRCRFSVAASRLMDSLGSRSHATVGRHESSNAARSQTVGAVICRYQCLCIDTIESLCSAEALALAKSLGEHGLCRLALSCKPWHRTDRCIATIAVTLQLSSSACHKTQAIYGTAEMRRLRCMMQPRSIADAVWWIARCLAMLLQTWDFAVAPDRHDIMAIAQELCLTSASAAEHALLPREEEERLHDIAMQGSTGI